MIYPQLCLTLDSSNYPILDQCRNAVFWSSSYVRGTDGADDGYTLTTSRSGKVLYLGKDSARNVRAFESGVSIKYLWQFTVTSLKVDLLAAVSRCFQ
jgi:hypothetical protein